MNYKQFDVIFLDPAWGNKVECLTATAQLVGANLCDGYSLCMDSLFSISALNLAMCKSVLRFILTPKPLCLTRLDCDPKH